MVYAPGHREYMIASLAKLNRPYPADLLALAGSCPLPTPVTRDAIQAAVGLANQVFSLRAERVHHRLVREGRLAFAAAFYRDANPEDQQAILDYTDDGLLDRGRAVVANEAARILLEQEAARLREAEASRVEAEARWARAEERRIQAMLAEQAKQAAALNSERATRDEEARLARERRLAEAAKEEARILAEREAAKSPVIVRAIRKFAGKAIAGNLSRPAARHTAIRKALAARGIKISIFQAEMNEDVVVREIADKQRDRAARAETIPAERQPGLFAAAMDPAGHGRKDTFFTIGKSLSTVHANEAGITRHEIISGWTGSRAWRRPIIDNYRVPLKQRLLYRQVLTAVAIADGTAKTSLPAFVRSAAGRRPWSTPTIRKIVPLVRDAETAVACANALIAGIEAKPEIVLPAENRKHLIRLVKFVPGLAAVVAGALLVGGVDETSMRQLARISRNVPLDLVA